MDEAGRKSPRVEPGDRAGRVAPSADSNRAPGRARPTSVRVRIAALLAVTTFLGSTPASAFDLFGLHLFGSDKADEVPAPDARRYTVAFRVETSDPDLEKALQAASTLWSEREGKPPPSTPALLSRASGDYGRLLAALRSAGYYGGAIAITVDGRPVEDLAPDATLADPAAVAVTIDSGRRFVFGSVAMKGRAAPDAARDERAATPESLGLLTGEPARADVVLNAETALVDAWKRAGHPKARALPRVLVAHHRTGRLDVELAVEPGPAAVYGQVKVAGTKDMDPAFVARQTGLTPGRPWNPAEIEEARKRLRRLQVFSSTRIVEDPAIDRLGALGMTVQVAERPLHVFGGGASYSTVDGTGIEGYWQHRNLFGAAESLKLEAKVSGIAGVDPRDFSYKAAATFLKPGIFTPYTDLTAQILASREVLDTYTQDTIRARIGLAHEITTRLTAKTAFNLEFDKVDDAYGKRDLILTSLPSELAWDGSDDKREPSRGFRAKAAVEPFYEAKFGNTGAILRFDASAYRALDPDRRFVLAGRIGVGSLVGARAAELPPDRLFFAGGGQSVRGYGYRTLGPIGPGGAVVGGRSLIEGSLELRMKLTDTIGVVPFVDAGSAYAGRVPDFSERPKIGAGLGLRYYTGLGAIRVDAAVPVDPVRGDPRFALYIGLGESF